MRKIYTHTCLERDKHKEIKLLFWQKKEPLSLSFYTTTTIVFFGIQNLLGQSISILFTAYIPMFLSTKFTMPILVLTTFNIARVIADLSFNVILTRRVLQHSIIWHSNLYSKYSNTQKINYDWRQITWIRQVFVTMLKS